jgi:CheY-like chemotaxis protein
MSPLSDPSNLSHRTLILAVEDEPAVRAVAVEALEDDGFEVIEAPSADHAATILQARDDIAVVFTDVTMPGNLNGFDLARIAPALHGNIPVIIASGHCRQGFPAGSRRTISPEALPDYSCHRVDPSSDGEPITLGVNPPPSFRHSTDTAAVPP